ncbi:MAG TPA: helix-turn-helix domain-containing protein [Polyangiaceae bacterium]|nr:helix-turn-helix domain-containing protein [Polyangiaceae bacterium]
MEPADALSVLVRALAPYLLETLRDQEAAAGWVDVAVALPTCKRALWRACRRGELPARRLKRRWLARRSDLDTWIESHPTGTAPPPRFVTPKPVPSKEAVLSPAQQHEKETEALYKQLGLRRLNDAERAAKGLPPYDVDREYAEHLAAQARRAEEAKAKERADHDPAVAKQRAEATRAADAARAQRPSKLPRVECARCRRQVAQRKDGRPVAHACPHQFGRSCSPDGDDSDGTVPHCPWCRSESP